MKNNYSKYNFFCILAIFFISCEDQLKEDVFSQISSDELLKTESGINSLLTSAYGYADYADRWAVNLDEFTTDIAYQTGGYENGICIYYLNFTWDPSTTNLEGFYTRGYNAIRDVNVLLESIDNAEMSDPAKLEYTAEAKFIRALSYARMYYKFGPVPLRTSTEDDYELPRADEDELKTFIEEELLEAIENLPLPGTEAGYGRATKGAAMGVLCKFYLNSKQWQKAADLAQDIIALDYYELFSSYEDMFKIENEENKEMIWVNSALANSAETNTYISAAFPTAFASWPEKGLTFQTTWTNPATQYRLRDNFYHSFEAGDKRKELILTQYVNKSGSTVNLLSSVDNTRSFKYWPDPSAVGEAHGNDLPEIRYADILLSRAEALNELNGPEQESIDLINQVRERAGLTDLSVSDFSKETLRDHILKERGWEFYSEGQRRLDLIRMDKFVEYALDRGVANAKDYHKLFPIPQAERDANPLVDQNTGY